MSSASQSRDWLLPAVEPESIRVLEQELTCPRAIARLLASRGISTAHLHEFFSPSLGDLNAPELMLGIVSAVDRIQQAVSRRESILIYGDYDVDGTTATVLLKTAIDRMSARDEPSLVTWHVPHRVREGYGMRTSRIAEAATAGVRLIISVDTGIRAFAAAEEARSLGLDLIVTDHHLTDGEAGIPEAYAVINPAQPGCNYPCKQLCGAAVAFKLAHALLRSHADAQPDPEHAMQALEQRVLPSFLKLVAIATIADAVPLTGENRVLAKLGLSSLANPVQHGLRALMTVAGLELGSPPSAMDIGFRLGPRINAAGRMDIADDVIELLLTRSAPRAQELAEKLDLLNEERRRSEQQAMATIEDHLERARDDAGTYPAECLVLDHPEWHRGVLGILASRVVERTGRPALVLTCDGDELHGSGRSVPGFHLLDALTAISNLSDEDQPAALFTRFGGHAHAVGLTLPHASLAALRDRLRMFSRGHLSASVLSPPLHVDVELALDELTFDLTDWLRDCEPFGNGYPEPVFVLREAVLRAPVRIIKDRHLCLTLQGSPGGPALRAMAWSRASRQWTEEVRALELGEGSRIDLAFRLRATDNNWFTGLELEVVDMHPSLTTPA